MAAPVVSQEELQRVHRALCITVPLEQASPMLLTTLAVVAHCWRQRGAPKIAVEPVRDAPRLPCRPDTPTTPFIDLKRRAAGDLD